MCMDFRCACISSDEPKNTTLYGEHNTVKLVFYKGKKEKRINLKPVELTIRTCRNPRLGFQSFFSVLTQISPFVAMFG